jgi:DNA-binding GntR family transcriptional regulator
MSSIPRLLVGESLADQAHRVLRDLITSGEFSPGEGLTERGLADRLGVSPTPVREAIARLEHERLLVRVDGRSLRVASPSLAKLEEMVLIRGALSGVAARLAARNATDGELKRINDVHLKSLDVPSKSRSADEVAQEAFTLRRQFHHLIEEASHNPSLVDMIETSNAFDMAFRVRAVGAVGAKKAVDEGVKYHEQIVDALFARDGERAEALMREHRVTAGQQYLAFAQLVADSGSPSPGADG